MRQPVIRTPTLDDADLTIPGLPGYTDDRDNPMNVEAGGFRNPATGEFLRHA
jgi:hypothetical protein